MFKIQLCSVYNSTVYCALFISPMGQDLQQNSYRVWSTLCCRILQYFPAKLGQAVHGGVLGFNQASLLKNTYSQEFVAAF